MENGEEKITWFGQKIDRSFDISIDSVLASLPQFSREPFGSNNYLDVILREPFMNDGRAIPVASVSKSYALVQHSDIVKALGKALGDCHMETESLRADLMRSEYGERMCLEVRIPKFDFNPGDGHDMAMVVTCINSVDKSCALEITMQWKRLVCSNGMVRAERSNLRRIHNTDWLNAKNIEDYLKEEFAAAPGDQGVYDKWRKSPLTIPAIEKWADEVLSQEWGVHAAARTCHIARTGYDGAVEDPFEKALPHEKKVTSVTEVPGSCAPVENIFHVSQILSWIASHRNTIEDRFVKTREIYDLVRPLVNPSKA
jgi:hypothetical protein